MRVKFNIESLYKIFIFLLIAMYMLEATSIPNVNNSLFHDVIQYSALLVAIIYIVIRKYSNKELIRNSFLVLIGILCYVSSGFSGLLMTVLAIILMPNNYLEIILKMILKEETILFGIIVIFSLLGVLDMGGVKINKGSYITDGVSLGFTHPNMLAAQGTSIILLYLCLNKDKLKTRHYIVSLMCEILLFVLSKGRSSFFLGIFAIILIGMSKMNIIKKIILKFLPFAYWAILGALIFCMFIYARDNGTSAISGLINDGFFNGRKDKDDRLKMTDNYFCVNFCIGNFCMICFSLLAQPFIKLFFGERMLLSFSTALWLGINLMLTFLIQLPSQVFVIYKLFRYDRPIIITSAVLNIVMSIALVNKLGINGVLIGTFITSLIYLFSRFYIIARYVYKIKYNYYVKKVLYYAIISCFTFIVSYLVSENIKEGEIIWFIIKTILVVLLALFLTSLFLSFSREFEFLKNKLLPANIRKFVNKYTIGIGSVLVMGISISLSILCI